MASEAYRVTAEQAVETVAQLLERGDVRSVRVEDVDGEPLLQVPGTSSPEGGAKQLMERWQDYEPGGGTTLTVIAETGPPPDAPAHGRILDEPPEHPREGEPRSHE